MALPSHRPFTDHAGRDIDLRRYGEGPLDDEFEALVALYREFPQSQRSSGVPPNEEPAIRPWLERILTDYCTVAWHDGRAVGQVVLVDDRPTGYELAMFVHPDYQFCGIGTELMAAVLADAVRDDVERVYLLTENPAMAAIAYNYGYALTDRFDGQLTLARDLGTATPPVPES